MAKIARMTLAEYRSQDLEKMTNHFSKHRKIGDGGYGDVYLGVTQNGELIAVKKLNSTMDGYDDREFMNELANHTKVEHPNIVRVVGYCNDENNKILELVDGALEFGADMFKALCFEYMPGGSLAKKISGNSLGNDWLTHYNLIKGICEGLNYLQCGSKYRIFHRDLKPANILLDKSMTPKLADFGLSLIYKEGLTTHVEKPAGTRKYMAPEYLKDGKISDKTDIFSLGVTIIEVIRGSDGFDRYCDLKNAFIEDVHEYWKKKDMTADLDHVDTFTKIAIRCVNPDENKRPTIKEIMENFQEARVLSQNLHALGLDSTGRFSPPSAPWELPSSISGRGPVNVVIVCAFDRSTSGPAWSTVNDGVYWMLHEKLNDFAGSSLGYIYFMSSNNSYTTDMKLVNSAGTSAVATGYYPWPYPAAASTMRTMPCGRNMACGLAEAQNMVSTNGQNGMILLFSDGATHWGNFFEGAEDFTSKVPVHTFTLGGDADNKCLRAIAEKSQGGEFHEVPVPAKPNLKAQFWKQLDRILGCAKLDLGEPPMLRLARESEPLDVVIIYGFDCSVTGTPMYILGNSIYLSVQEKLKHFTNSCLGYICPLVTENAYTRDMKLVDAAESVATGGSKAFSWGKHYCTNNMASGLALAQEMVSERGYLNGTILLISDGMIKNGNFFDGAENFKSTVPVHTFTIGWDQYNQGLKAIAENSEGGKFHKTAPTPYRQDLWVPFSIALDGILAGAMRG